MGAMRALVTWASEWVETWRVAPPLSRRRQELLAIIADNEPDSWVEVERP